METHKEIKDYFNQLVDIFGSYLNTPENKILPFQSEKHEWINLFYQSPILRHGHLEFYKTNKICVLHANIFPDPRSEIPILGFDMIALNDKITGLFFDYTPTFATFAKLEHELENLKKYKSEKRNLPTWADFFSNNFFCVEPLPQELPDIIKDIIESLNTYFNLYKDELLRYNLKIKKQNSYCQGQKKNSKTLKALSTEIGEKNAKLFLNEYLFPEIT